MDSDKKDNLYKVAWALIKALKVRVTGTALRTALGHADSQMSLAVLVDALNKWKIETIAVRIKHDQLTDIEFPAIAHLKAMDGLKYFVMLIKLKGGKITYYDSELGEITELVDEFTKKWEGIILFATPNEGCGEKNYIHNRRQEILANLRFWTPIAIAILCISWGISQPMPKSSILLSMIKAIGIIASIALLKIENNSNNFLLESICHLNKRTDCISVLNSSAAKLFGLIGMSEIGLVYFTGGMLTIYLAAFGHIQPSVMPFLALLNLLALPYTVFSIYYQKWVIKKWCPLCLGVQVIFWIEFIICWHWTQDSFIPKGSAVGLCAICFTIPIAFWMSFKPLLNVDQRLSVLVKEAARFRENKDLFQTLLESEPVHEMRHELNEIILGQPNAPVTLTMVSGPLCSPCERAHQAALKLLADYPDELRVIIRFVVNDYNEQDLSNKMARHMLALAEMKPDQLAKAIDYWYQIRNVDQLKSRFPVQQDNTIAARLERQISWKNEVGINVTPTFFVNCQRLPKYFKVEDLGYHIHYLYEIQKH